MKGIFLLFIILFSFEAFSQKDTVSPRFSKTITETDLSKHLHVLASDEYEGRETGEKGQKIAAKYIADQFRSYGIPPLPNGSYYQEYRMVVEDAPEIKLSINNKAYTAFKDYSFYPSAYYGGSVLEEVEIKAEDFAFVGYGITEGKYNDYKKVNVKGKIAVAFSREPVKDSISLISGKKTLSNWSYSLLKKHNLAKKNGARALILILPDDQAQKFMAESKKALEHGTSKLDGDTAKEQTMIPVIYITESMANELVRSKGKTAAGLRAKISAAGKPASFIASADITLSAKRNVRKLIAENVIGYIEGSDLKNEVIIITAHYDHLGIRDGKVYNGADDDGSGTVAIMEMAEAFAKAKKEGKGPRRSLVFIAFSGEEKGLFGSKYYVDNPIFPLANTIANLNIDMIGRQDEKYHDDPDYIYIIGSNMLSTDLHNINENANKAHTNIKLDYTYNTLTDKNRYYYRSDHYNFAKNKIPVIFYFNGVHADYHKDTDEVHKINFNKMEKITRLVFHTAWDLANRDERIKLDEKK
jgi:hypothetical protein